MKRYDQRLLLFSLGLSIIVAALFFLRPEVIRETIAIVGIKIPTALLDIAIFGAILGWVVKGLLAYRVIKGKPIL